MKAHAEDDAPQYKVRLGLQEMQRIVGVRKNLDLTDALADATARYLKLGWSPLVFDTGRHEPLDIDFSQPPEVWKGLLMDLAMRDIHLGLAIRLEAPLFTLRIKTAGSSTLHRALREGPDTCSAWAGDLEHHFFMLPRGWEIVLEAEKREDPEWTVICPGEAVAVPPSPAGREGESWSWHTPPWEVAPALPPETLLAHLARLGALIPPALGADLPTWEEIYAAIGHLERLFKVLLAPCPSVGVYFRQILGEALQAGVTDPRLIKGLLWHAPHGELPRHPTLARQLFEAVDRFPGLWAAKGSRPEPAEKTRDELADRLQGLAAKTQELERQLAVMRQEPAILTSKGSQAPSGRPETQAAIPCWAEWLKLLPQPQPDPAVVAALRETVQALLAEEPGIAADPKKIHLLLYCYHNYVDADPSFAGLSLREKLSRALVVAREFIKALVGTTDESVKGGEPWRGEHR